MGKYWHCKCVLVLLFIYTPLFSPLMTCNRLSPHSSLLHFILTIATRTMWGRVGWDSMSISRSPSKPLSLEWGVKSFLLSSSMILTTIPCWLCCLWQFMLLYLSLFSTFKGMRPLPNLLEAGGSVSSWELNSSPHRLLAWQSTQRSGNKTQDFLFVLMQISSF